MSGDDKPKKKMRRLLSVIISGVVLVVTVAIVLSVIPGTRQGISRVFGIFSANATVDIADEFIFDVGRDREFAHADGSIAAVGSLGVQVLNASGRETLRDSFRMSRPAIVEAGGNFLAFDVGGTAVRVFNDSHVLTSIESDGEIVSASINQNGWFCVIKQEHEGFRGAVTVYNGIGMAVYRVSLQSGYIISAMLSPDNRNLAILNLTPSGSRITFYNGIDANKDEPDHIFDLPGGLIIDINYISNMDVLAISTNSLYLVGGSGGSNIITSYSDKRLGGYTINDNFIALHLYDYGIGYSGRLMTLLFDGTILGEIELDHEIISMTSYRDSLTILRNDGFAFFNDHLDEFPVSGDTISAAAASHVLALGEGLALAASDHSAVLIRREEER